MSLLAPVGVEHGVLHDVSLTAEPGMLVALTGHSGSGKSTLCHLIAGLEKPTAGRVELAGEPTVEVADWGRISVVPQRLALLEQLTISGEPCPTGAFVRSSGRSGGGRSSAGLAECRCADQPRGWAGLDR